MKKLVSLLLAALMLLSLSPMAIAEGHEVTFVFTKGGFDPESEDIAFPAFHPAFCHIEWFHSAAIRPFEEQFHSQSTFPGCDIPRIYGRLRQQKRSMPPHETHLRRMLL